MLVRDTQGALFCEKSKDDNRHAIQLTSPGSASDGEATAA